MPEELQSLLERIQKEGIEKAESEANRILSAAHVEAAGLVAKAREDAARLLAKAEQDSTAFEARARVSLAQAARDVILTVGEAVQEVCRRLVRQDISQALSEETLQGMLTAMVQHYFQKAGGSMEILVSPHLENAVRDFFANRFAGELKKGLVIRSDDEIIAGFRIRVVEENVEHDFTSEAITEALAQRLRPQIAQIVRDALARTQP